jgi:hypothetical protein
LLADLLDLAGRHDEAAGIYDDVSAQVDAVSSTLRAEALLSRVQQQARAGDLDAAAALLDRAATLPLDDDVLRTIQAQRAVVRSTSPAAAALRDFFWSPGDRTGRLARLDAALVLEPNNGLGHYLRGRNSIGVADPTEVARSLISALELGLPHPLIRRECARLLTETAFRVGDMAQVADAAAILAEATQPLVTRLYAADWLERIDFRRQRTVANTR